MIHLRFGTATLRWGKVMAEPREYLIGQASVAFMEEFECGNPAILEMEIDCIVVLRLLSGDCQFATVYTGKEVDLRFIREALWYYTGSFSWRGSLPYKVRSALERHCKKFRRTLEQDADRLPFDANPVVHWRQALLFAARVDPGTIDGMLALDERRFALSMIEAMNASVPTSP